MSAEGLSVKGSSQQSWTSGPQLLGGLFSGPGPLIMGGLVNDTTPGQGQGQQNDRFLFYHYSMHYTHYISTGNHCSGGSRISPRRGRQLPRGCANIRFCQISPKTAWN